jgi:subtilisin family serine protease
MDQIAEYLPEGRQTQTLNYLNNLWEILAQEHLLAEKKRKQQRQRRRVFKQLSLDESLELVFLTFYYSTSLTIEEILSLDQEKIQKNTLLLPIFADKKYILSRDLQEMISHLDTLGLKHKKLFTGRNAAWGVHVISKYPNTHLEREVGPYSIIQKQSDFGVIPTPLKLKADPAYRGRGITIAFIDSGFYPHPDLTQPFNRILAYYDTTNPKATLYDLNEASQQSWHGMQTSVSCVGNGFLSKGLYRGIASEANVVLIKVCSPQGTSTQDIVEGFQWAVQNRDKYNIRILNVSLGSHQDISFRESEIDRAAELAVHAGITVVRRRRKTTPIAQTTPPGKLSFCHYRRWKPMTKNQLNMEKIQMYWSSFWDVPLTAILSLKSSLPESGFPALPILPNTQGLSRSGLFI